jgi:hypothetical protein
LNDEEDDQFIDFFANTLYPDALNSLNEIVQELDVHGGGDSNIKINNKIYSRLYMDHIQNLKKDEIKAIIKCFKKERNFGKMTKKELSAHLEYLLKNGERKKGKLSGHGFFDGMVSNALDWIEKKSGHVKKPEIQMKPNTVYRKEEPSGALGAGIGQYFGALGQVGDMLFGDDDEVDEEEEAREQARQEREAMIKAREDAIQQEKDTNDAIYNMNRRNRILGDFMADMVDKGYIKPKAKTFSSQEAKNKTEEQRKARIAQERTGFIGGALARKFKK